MHNLYIAAARHLSHTHLASHLPRRWRHTQGVAAQARRLAELAGPDAALLEAAAWLHDIGYAPDIAATGTGFHPLDGARYLRAKGWSDRITGLVAHHTGAIGEAELRGLTTELATEFTDQVIPVRDALWYCDLTTSPDGEVVTFDVRIAEILARYTPDSIVAQFISAAVPDLRQAVDATLARAETLTSNM